MTLVRVNALSMRDAPYHYHIKHAFCSQRIFAVPTYYVHSYLHSYSLLYNYELDSFSPMKPARGLIILAYAQDLPLA